MNLKTLNINELDQRIRSLAQKERDVLCEILLTIKEIDCRRTYLDLGFPSLFEYLTKSVGYSEGSAQRRIDAARLLQEIPQMAAKIQTGEIKLNQISLIQKASRELARTRTVQIAAEDKLALMNQVANLNHSASQLEIASFFDLPIREETHIRVQANESVRVELTLSKELHEKIKQAQELISHSLPSADLVQYLEFVSERIIRQKTGVRTKEEHLDKEKVDLKSMNVVRQPGEASKATATVAVKASVYKRVLLNQKCCQFKDAVGKQCGSRWHLQVDHIQPRWAGGSNEIENLQVLCAQHNRLKYQKEAGIALK